MAQRGKLKKLLDDVPKQLSKPREDSEFRLIKKIGSQIKADLVHNQLSVDRLAINSETSRGSVRRIIDGSANPSITTLDRITKALGYKDVIEFFTRIDKNR